MFALFGKVMVQVVESFERMDCLNQLVVASLARQVEVTGRPTDCENLPVVLAAEAAAVVAGY